MTNVLLTLTAVVEAVTGVVLLLTPSLVVKLLFGAAIAGVEVAVGRFAGITLIALGVACWPAGTAPALSGMLTYNTATTLYLGYLGVGGEWAGIILWPAVAAHAILTVLLTRAWLNAQTTHP